MPPNLARMYPPVSFWNFSSAAAAAPNVATARHASAVTRSRRFFQFFLVLIEAILGRSSGWGRLLKHDLQGRTRGCYEVWLSGRNVELRNQASSTPLEVVLQKPPPAR